MKNLVLLLIILFTVTFSQEAFSRESDDGLDRIYVEQLIQDMQYDSAMVYLDHILQHHPQSYRAYIFKGYVYTQLDESKEAIEALNKAIKYCPAKDKEYRAMAYCFRGISFDAPNDTAHVIGDIQKAIQIDPDNYVARMTLAEFYQQYNRPLNEIETVYNDILQANSAYIPALLALAECKTQEDDGLAKAKDLLARARFLDPDNNDIDRMEMIIAAHEGNPKELYKKALKVYAKNPGREATEYVFMASDSIYTYIMKDLSAREATDSLGKYILLKAYCQRHHKDYENAVKTLQKVIDKNLPTAIGARSVQLNYYYIMGDMEHTDSAATEFLRRLPEITDARLKRADARFFCGKYAEARADYYKAMSEDADYSGYCYYKLGWIEEMEKHYDQALAMYDKSITLDPDYAYTYMMKGMLLLNHLNRPDEGKKMLRLCIEKDSIMEDGTCMQYAYAALGMKDKAIEIVDSILTLNPDAENYYDAACVYSRMGMLEKAVGFLRQAFEKGYRLFKHVENDDDLNPLRDLPGFKALMKEYEGKI